MEPETDTSNGGESLSIEQAAAAYVKATSAPEVVKDQPEPDTVDESDETTDDELQASEDASEEDDGETADEDQAEDGEEADPESDQGRFVSDNAKVRLPDGTVTTIAELKSGSLRNADYTRKTQEVAEQRKAVETQSAAIKASEQQLEQQREYVVSLVKSILPPRPDISMVDPTSPHYDPAGYQTAKANFEAWAEHLANLETEQQRTQQERQAETAKQAQERVQKEWTKALEILPELKDQSKLEAFGKDTLKYGPELGYTPEELANIHHDHRNLRMMKLAIAQLKLQASKATAQKKVEGRPPVIKGGKRLNPSEHQARRAGDAFNRLKSSGSVDDAAAAYLASRK